MNSNAMELNLCDKAHQRSAFGVVQISERCNILAEHILLLMELNTEEIRM